ncbi:MAG: UvrD-helicase domain-containing protein [Pseudomonadota bacterium]|nr:UvrD-helicase domain-containing protein [Pseudomonadota bacterium]
MIDLKEPPTSPLDVFNCRISGIVNIEASAGTGKTWAICGLYLRLVVEASLTVDRILVVTFTKAATAELRARIRDRLREVLQSLEEGDVGGADPFVKRFLQRIETLGGEAAKHAGARLRAALFSFEDAAIFTIHAFCRRALEEVPLAAVQPFQMEVTADDGDVIRETAADYWRRIAARYDAGEIDALLQTGFNPDWLVRELRRRLSKPTAGLVFPAYSPNDPRGVRRAVCLRRILLKFGPGAVRAAKRRRRVIAYDDMLHNLHEALTGGRLPELAGTLRSRYPAALIDEFQDTDPLQFAIFRSLYFNEGTMFMVGDPKQAVYSFRNADLHAYLVAKRYADRRRTLQENQRSEPGLITAVNALFKANENVFGSPEIRYRPVVRGDKPLRELQGDPEPREPLSIWLLPPGEKGKPLKTAEARQFALAATTGEIARLLAAGGAGRLTVGGEPLQARDIAVLVRTREQGRIVKAALARGGIGSADITDRSVFAAPEAEEMERILRAVADPADAGLTRAALTTVLMGRDSRELAQLNADTEAFSRVVESLDRQRRRWRQQGFGAMWRGLMVDERIVERLLPAPGGERRLTNVMHLMELLSAAEDEQAGIERLLHWLAERRADPREEDETLLRLESDENLVQIVTKHRSKGLEWPIVFCPFIWQERGPERASGQTVAYHEGDRLFLDFTGTKEAKRRQEYEQLAERVRLIYVAITRAENRCYLVAGPFWQTHSRGATEKKARRSMMNWIVAGVGEHPGRWAEGAQTGVAAIGDAWRKLIAASPGMGLAPLPADLPASLPGGPAAPAGRARETARTPGVSWRLASYSSLVAGSAGEDVPPDPEGRDYDLFASGPEEDDPHWTPAAAPPSEGLPDDILDFPAGVTAGHCLHRVLERIDFQDEGGWEDAIGAALTAYPPAGAREGNGGWAAMIRGMLADILAAPLPGGFSLRDVTRDRRLTEMEFAYPAAGLDPNRLGGLLARRGRRLPKMAFPELTGYLRGFIDLVFAHRGKWYVLDWKSNRLGVRPEDYAPPHLAEEMFRHAYELQALIYLTALHRYLRHRQRDYDYDVHMGGALYIFVRGFRPSWPDAGVWHDRPDRALIEELEELFFPASAGEGVALDHA